MIPALPRRAGPWPERFRVPMLSVLALIFAAAARAQLPLLNPAATRTSISGQFIVIGVNPDLPRERPPLAVTNAEFVRLQPALLAVSAERVKQPLWNWLGLGPGAQWQGRIYLALHPAASLDENVAIMSIRYAGAWNYRVELPDALSRTRLVRALTGVVLLELANRGNPGDRSAEIPPWLTEGLAQQLIASVPELIVSPPDSLVNGVPESQVTVVERGLDSLVPARAALSGRPALTFDQLSWPDGAQLNGDDGGVYRASAQLFVSRLLELDQGAAHLRAMLQMLPRGYNWQTAFRAAFAPDFPRPIDIEKWWALQTVSFAARSSGAQWTPAASRGRLEEILRVPVEMRSAPTNLPVHTLISLQAVIRDFDFDRQTGILQNQLRDLQLAQWQLAPPEAGLAAAYQRALANYLGLAGGAAPSARGIKSPPSKKRIVATLKELDLLDAQRQAMATASASGAPARQP